MTLRATLLVLTVVAAGCAPAANGKGTERLSLAAEVLRDVNAGGAVPWSSTRPLRWADFRGDVPAGRTESASTAYSLFYGMRCQGSRLEFLVTAAFLPDRSWVRPAVLTNPERSRRTLAHEQTHFDLSEFHARRMRKYFAELYDGCAQRDDLLRSSAERFIQDEAEAQARYDDETRYGVLENRQIVWDRYAAEMLASLRSYGQAQ